MTFALWLGVACASPGWSSDLEALEPGFGAKVRAVIARLEEAGFTVVVTCTFRGAAMQDLIYEVAPGRSTQARGGQSCHDKEHDGTPAALAADLWPHALDLRTLLGEPDPRDVPFFRALGVAAKAEGLRWGGDWHGRASSWDAHGLGWDPAHVELGRCGS